MEHDERSGTWVSHYTCVSVVQGSVAGLGMGRPFPHVKAWGGTAQITTQGHRYLFSGRFQISGDRGTQLLRAIRLWEDHFDEKITHDEVGWSPVRNHPVYVRGGQVSDWEESQVFAALAVSELPAAALQ